MYEIWLTLNILWELAWCNWPWLLAAALPWLAISGLALLTSGSRWKVALRPSLLLALLAGIITFLLAPALSRSSFSNVTYLADWVNLLAIGMAGAAAAWALLWPLLAWCMRGGTSAKFKRCST